jgi:hypothetical protein
VSAPVKIEVEEKVWQLVETVLKPKYIAPPPHEGDSNYLVDIYTNRLIFSLSSTKQSVRPPLPARKV